MKQNRVRSFLGCSFLHPLLIALYPVLSFWLVNFDQVEAAAVVRPLVYALVVVSAVLLAGWAVFREWKKAALLASLFTFLFFTYGHVLELIDMKAVFGLVLGRHRYLIPIWLSLFALGTGFIWRARPALMPVTRLLNITSLFLITLSVVQFAYLGLATWTARSAANRPDSTAAALTGSVAAGFVSAPRRDVYLIVMDAYARQDVLAEQHGLDNSDFIQQLRDLGFVVMDCAQSNYGYTSLSMGSLLNMNYMDELGVVLDPEADALNYWAFKPLLTHSLVRQKFEALDYRTVTFKPLYAWMDAPDSDVYLDVEKSSGFFDKQASVNFHYLFQRTTAMRVIQEYEESSPDFFNRLPPWLVRIANPKGSLLHSRNIKQYEQNLFALDALASAAGIPGPKFFYAHLFITHQPYVFRPDGSLRWPVEATIEAYNDQVRFSNTQLIPVLKRLISESEVPPVIVLQSDHGYMASEQDRMKILNAYYLPDGGAQQLYPTITPVNSFRLIFNYYFGESLPVLDDRSFYSPVNRPGRLEETSVACPVGE